MKENRTKQNADAVEGTVVAETKTNKKNLIIKILLVAVILIAIAAIWMVKNNETALTQTGGAMPAEVTESDEAALSEEQNDDFVLEAEAIDLATLLSYKLPIIIDFGSDSCIPCKEMAPVLKSANADYQGKAIIKFVDVWKYTDAANNFPVQVIPTQIFINADGTPYVPSKDLGIEFSFYSSKDTQEHVFTAHQGGLTEEQMLSILTDMGVSK